jgi:hypothetical protein
MAKRDEKKDIRNFGLMLAAILAGFGGLSIYKQGNAWPILWGIAGVVLVCALFVKPALRPVFKGFMWFGMKMNWVMTRVILTVFFFIVLAPIGICMRIFRKDLMGRNYDPNAKTFWTPPKRSDYKPEYSERLF